MSGTGERGAPKAIGPYRPAVAAGELVFLSGQIPLDPETGRLVGGGTGPQTERALANLQAVLRAEGLAVPHVVKTTVFLTDIGDFAAMNEAYAAFFGEVRPARSAVQVAALPAGASVEIEAVAWRGVT
jgi:2-iminobutanoate/2-iminopropanoate deaminase